MEWIPLLTLFAPVYMTLVKLFYCKAKFFEVGVMMSIKSSVKGIEYDINGDKIY